MSERFDVPPTQRSYGDGNPEEHEIDLATLHWLFSSTRERIVHSRR